MKLNILPIFIHERNLKRIMIKICTGNTELVVNGEKNHCIEHTGNHFGNAYGE